MNRVLELLDVRKKYGNGPQAVQALRGVSFSVEQPGQMIVILGPSGCGKTTLLSMIGGLDRPTSGKVRLDDQDLANMNPHQLTRLRCRKIGFVFQVFNLIPNLTALENVMLPMEFAGVNAKDEKRRATTLLEQVGLGLIDN